MSYIVKLSTISLFIWPLVTFYFHTIFTFQAQSAYYAYWVTFVLVLLLHSTSIFLIQTQVSAAIGDSRLCGDLWKLRMSWWHPILTYVHLYIALTSILYSRQVCTFWSTFGTCTLVVALHFHPPSRGIGSCTLVYIYILMSFLIFSMLSIILLLTSCW